MNYQDAKEYLHIAENAFLVEAYAESAEIVTNLAYFVINKDNGHSAEQRTEISTEVQKAIGRFTYCPDECIWEEMCGLMDLFRQ